MDTKSKQQKKIINLIQTFIIMKRIYIEKNCFVAFKNKTMWMIGKEIKSCFF